MEKLDEGDFKAQLVIANALGRIGAEAIAPLMSEFSNTPEPDRRLFILYALGNIKSPRIAEAAQMTLDAARSS